MWGRPLWLSSLRVRHRARVRVVDSSSGSESRVVPAVTLTSEEARPVPVGGSATRPRGPFGSGTSAPRNSSFPISEVPFCGSGPQLPNSLFLG
ncbi:hypothetical protein SAVERM_1p97 (plasmid) [Streptomyces avermitilis MA-4680 = NBRC 14893]|uniref:Uncharacterized protein n=1 Tax=Streptomyces avermitilis (strain ATCC 31267 / DSM 46492 / JCM 5070 / NBRC 14893 / NCIMB 12804 / NRRL 8165 / MA-4680) TaxID=227882 RepID=A0A146FBW5_STRAW|nr:hypothetical protein SAVERM_1p97 [Streptomyces avermitilis MA-4680 = NBRC 14893]